MAVITVADALIPSKLNTPLDKRTKINTKSELSTIQNPSEGLLIYVKDEKATYQVNSITLNEEMGTYYIADSDVSVVGGASVEFSDGIEPTDINTIWVDSSDDNFDFDETLFDRIRTELNKLHDRISDIEYAFDVKMDSGDTTYYKGSEFEKVPGVSPETEYDVILSFTYDGDTLTFERTDIQGQISDINLVTLRYKDQDVVTLTAGKEIGYNENTKEYQVRGLNDIAFDEIIITDYSSNVIYKASISSSDLASDDPTWSARLQPNVHHICIKRAESKALLEEYVPQEGELVYSTFDNKLYVGYNGKPVIPNLDVAGSGNITASYIDLLSTDNVTTYRITVDPEGNLMVVKVEEDDEESQKPGPAGSENLKGLMISMAYAGPADATEESTNICSHSYIELYNGTGGDINLKGCSLQIGTTTWEKVIPLKGIIPAKGCYLVRLNPLASLSSSETKVKITDYDLDAYALDNEIKLTSDGFKIYLCVSNTVVNVNNPYDTNNGTIGSSIIGYIDLLGVGYYEDNGITVNAGELKAGANAPRLINSNRGVYRKFLADPNINGLGDTNNNTSDFLPFDYTSTQSPLTSNSIGNSQVLYKPWCSAYGAKTTYYNKTKLNGDKPNMPTFSLGESPSTRTFNWVSVTDAIEYLYYRLSGTDNWTIVEADQEERYGKQFIQNVMADGSSFYVHKVILRDLASGKYEWKIVREGSNYASDIFTFVVNAESLESDGSFTFCQVSDQQGWIYNEYEPWSIAMQRIINKANEGNSSEFPAGIDSTNNIHFLLNTGDMTQNGNRLNEWLDYYNSAITILPNVAQMNCIGNNDLCPGYKNGVANNKVEPTTFEYFYTYEYSSDDNIAASQQITNSNGELEFMKSVYAFDYGCTHFVCINSNNYIEEQKAWFEAHMTAVRAREIQPSWVIVYTHDAPFNIMVKQPNHSTTTFQATWEDVGKTGMRDTSLNQQGTRDPEKMFAWSRLFEKYEVDLVLSGHKHTYSRTYPLIENTIDEEIADTSLNTLGVQVSPWKPLYTTEGRYIEVNGESKKGVIYVMTQATGFKLQSNKDKPVPGIEWLASYFPASVEGSTATVNSDQKKPTFIMWNITPEKISMTTYQIPNLTNGGTWDYYGRGDKNTVMTDQEPIVYDTFEIIHS